MIASIADEVVVDDEGRPEADGAEFLELGQELLRLLHPGLAAEDHDDVAELALERAAAGILHGGRGVAVDLEQVEAGLRHRRHVGGPLLLVALPGRPAPGDVLQELRPGGLRLADEAGVAQAREELLVHRHERPAHDGEDLHLLELEEDLPHPLLLHDHPGDADDVVARQGLPVDVLDVLVEEGHLVSAAHPGHGRERPGDHRAPLVARVERKGEIEPPVGRLEPGIDEADRERANPRLRRRCLRAVHRRVFDELHEERVGRGRGIP